MVRRFVKKSYEDRRYSTKDKTRLEQDINLIRWFAVFIKCALELEGRSFEIQDEVHKVRFNKNHKWWKLINLKSFPKTPKFIRKDYKLLPSQMDKVSKQFEAKYKHLFVEKSTIFNPMKNEIPSDYEIIAFPKDYPIRKRISDMRLNYKEKEVKLKRGRKKIGKEKDSKTNADIVLENSSEELMRRLFNTLSIAKSQPKIRNLDIHFQVRKRIFKESIPTIEKLKSASGLIKGARVRTTRQKYDAKIRATQRDRRWAKILLINLCNGVFPKIDKVIL